MNTAKLILKKINYSLLFLLFCFLLQSCCNTSTETLTEQNNYIGDWRCVKRVFPYNAVLKIDSSYCYTYTGGFCTSWFESKGNWALKDDTLILNSFEPEECCYLREFGVNWVIVDSESLTIPKPKTSIEDCQPSNRDYEYIIFTNEKFIIKDSVLTHIKNPNNFCHDIKDNFTKINSNPQSN